MKQAKRMPVIKKVNPIMNGMAPQTVKSFLVVKAYAVMAKTAVPVSRAAPSTIIGSYLAQVRETSHDTSKVKTASSAKLIGTFLCI